MRREAHIDVVDRALLIEGRSRLLGAMASGLSLLAVVLFDLNREQELRFRQGLQYPHASAEGPELLPRRRGQRVVVTYPSTHNLLIRSDPYVITTARGYACAIDVAALQRPDELAYLLCSPRTLAVPLEEIRSATGTLVGTLLQVSRGGPATTAPYVVTQL